MFWWWRCAWTCGGDGVGRVAVAAQEERERELYFFCDDNEMKKKGFRVRVIYHKLQNGPSLPLIFLQGLKTRTIGAILA